MYGKMFIQMYDGTLATRGPWQALVTFQQLITLANRHGEVDMTAEVLSRRTTIPLDIILLGLVELAKPDPGSRSPDCEGRRIVPLAEHRDWGWRIVNYALYSKLRSEDERREYFRQHKAKTRAAKKMSTPVHDVTHTDVDVDTNTDTTKSKAKTARKRATPLPPGFAISEKVKNWSIEKGHQNLEAHLETFIRRAEAKGYTYVDWDAAFMNAIAEDWGKVRNPPAGRSLQERRVANMDDLTGRNRNERAANPVDGTVICAPVGYLRKPDDNDVG